jgi:integrase
MALEFQRGSVFLRGTRRKQWYGRYRTVHRDPDTGATVLRQHTKRIGPKSELTKFAAEERLRGTIAAESSMAPLLPADIAPKHLTLEWFVTNRYLPMMTCRETTKKKTADEIRRNILRQFGDRLVKEIGLFELQTHLNKLAKNFSGSVVRHAFVNIRSILNLAVDLDFIAKSPARRLAMPDTKPPDTSVMPATTIMTLLEGTKDPMDRCVLSIGIFCALRTSELFGLTWGSLQNGCLAIKNTAYEGRLQESKLKTRASRALVPIPDLVQPIIAEWHRRCEDTSPYALMFPTTGKRSRKGQKVPFDSTNFMERRIHPIADRLGLPRRLVTLQVMRRTVATDLQFHGTVKDAQTVLRHRSSVTTIDIYTQAVPESVKAALNSRTEAVFASVKAEEPAGAAPTTPEGQAGPVTRSN